jgi:hypothetical protein
MGEVRVFLLFALVFANPTLQYLANWSAKAKLGINHEDAYKP